jgi:hypothetical protein
VPSIVGWGAQFEKNWPGHSLARGNITSQWRSPSRLVDKTTVQGLSAV